MKFITTLLLAAFCLASAGAHAQKNEDKSKRPSPPVTVQQKIRSGATITIDYSQPSVKGRTIGKDLEPKDGSIWRAGANEATVFATDKAVTVEGKALPAGKYAFFILKKGDSWTLIFNKVWNTWGAYDYEKNKAQDALSVGVKQLSKSNFSEKLVYTISPDGLVSMAWGNLLVHFQVK